jgi:hypothetical protein
LEGSGKGKHRAERGLYPDAPKQWDSSFSVKYNAAVWADCTENAISHHFEHGKEEEARYYHQDEDAFIVSGICVRFDSGASCDRYMARICHQRAQTQCCNTHQACIVYDMLLFSRASDGSGKINKGHVPDCLHIVVLFCFI